MILCSTDEIDAMVSHFVIPLSRTLQLAPSPESITGASLTACPETTKPPLRGGFANLSVDLAVLTSNHLLLT